MIIDLSFYFSTEFMKSSVIFIFVRLTIDIGKSALG